MDINNSYAHQIQDRLRIIQDRFIAILQASRLERYEKKPHPYLFFSSNPPKGPDIKTRWIKLPPELEREQKRILREFDEWYSDFCGLFQDVTRDEEMQLGRIYIEMAAWIEYRKVYGQPQNVNEAIESFRAVCDQFNKFLDKLIPNPESTLILVVDTSAMIDCPDISQMPLSLNLSGVTIVVPSTTISELDDLKTGKRSEEFRRRLTDAIRNLKKIMSRGNVLEGIQLTDESTFKMLAAEPDFSDLPNWLDPDINDDRILAAAIELQRKNPSSYIAVLSNDINMHNKAALAGMPVKEVPDLFSSNAA